MWATNFLFPLKIVKNQYGKCTNMDFTHKFQKQRYICISIMGFLAVSRIQGCFHWLSNPIPSGVMADQTWPGTIVACAGLEGLHRRLNLCQI